MSRLWLTDPAVSFSVLPLALTLSLVLHAIVNPRTMHLIVFPFSYVPVTVRHPLCALAFDLPVLEISLILRLIWPSHRAFALHVVVFEIALV